MNQQNPVSNAQRQMPTDPVNRPMQGQLYGNNVRSNYQSVQQFNGGNIPGNAYNYPPNEPQRPLTKKEKKKAKKKAKKAAYKAKYTFGQRVKRFFIKCIAVLLALVIATSGCTGTLVYFDIVSIPFVESIFDKLGIEKRNKVGPDDFDILSADEVYFICGEESTITFTIKVNANVDKIELYKEPKEAIGTMHDDGADGDAVADDNIYTYSFKISSETEEEFKYYALINNSYKSEAVTIRFFDSLTINDYDDFVVVFNNIKDIEKSYMDESGNVNESNVAPCLIAIEKYAMELKEQGLVYCYNTYQKEDKYVSISIKLESGLEIVFVPQNGETLSSGKQLTIMSQIRSYINSEENCIRAENMFNFSVEGIHSLGDSHVWIKDEDVTLDTFKEMGSNQVILWSGHGVPTENCTYLEVQEQYDKIRFWIYDPVYFIELGFVQSKMCITSDGYLAVNYKYLRGALPDLTGSFVYLLSCTSGDDSNLCDAFIEKGAVSLVAVHESIKSTYGVKMQSTLGYLLTNINLETDNYYTVDEAMSLCYETYGRDDGNGAYPFVYSNGSLRGNYRIKEAEPGTLSGKICKAADRITAIENASIEVYRKDSLRKTGASNASGNYSLDLLEGPYYVKITAPGYIEFNAHVNIRGNETTYMETFLLIDESDDETGIAKGKVVNSLTGVGTSEVKISFKRDWNNENEDDEVIATVNTDSDGNYSVELPLGNYTAIATKEGFAQSSFNIIVQAGTTENQNGTITPEISGNNYLITLTWGENPRDLDSHVVGTLSNDSKFHVYYSDKQQYDGNVEVCNLDYDDTNSYGPEHITLDVTTAAPYYYYVYRYAGSGTVASSGAKVTIEQGNILIAEFHVPTDLGSGDYWNVFAIKNGKVIVSNTITNSANTSYAG